VLNQKWLPACAGMTDFFVMYGDLVFQHITPSKLINFNCIQDDVLGGYLVIL
jgi:hypothetical protein